MQYLDFVPDPISRSGEIVLRVKYPVGSFDTSEVPGGVKRLPVEIFGQGGGAERALVRYEVAFADRFDFVMGGKLPGLFGGDEAQHCTGGRNSDACFSLRLINSYLPLYDTFCDSEVVACNKNWGQSLGTGSFNFTAARWTTLTQLAILNSPPSPSTAPKTPANGILEVYQDDALAFSLDHVVFRTNPDVRLSSFRFASFFGDEHRPEFASRGGAAYFRNFQFFSGSEASGEQGELVTPWLPSANQSSIVES
ncbi:polysaccharide lyase family 14 protein [Pseudohyphozyma bogoriensis]|nr:polysaccharide lyase family 14 protein [Pseudohyphozyma bogoriensis]